MRFHRWLMAAVAFGLLGPAAPAGAPPQGKDNRRPGNEDERIVQVIDQVRTATDSEREKLVTALRRFAAANGAAGDDEAEDWFRLLAAGQPVWRRAAITPKPLVELFDLLAERIEAANDQITRAQFVDYARQALIEDSPPPWKTVEKAAVGEAAKVFNECDRNDDGQLAPDEMSNTLRSERQQWDKTRDGFIDRTEYRAFFLSRTQKVLADAAQRAEPKGDGRTAPARGGPAAAGLPGWFTPLDGDGDRQVGLYEWRESGWPVTDFQRLDRNGDGLLTTAEVLWAVDRAKSRGVPDAVLTRQLPPDFRKKGGGGV